MRFIFTFLLLCSFFTSSSQTTSNHSKVILITLDGLRWQDLFTGADAKLIANKKYVGDTTGFKIQVLAFIFN